MHMNKCFHLAYELKALLDNDSRILLLNELEKDMEEDEEIMALSYNKDLKETYLNDALKHFGKDSIEVRKANVEYFRAASKLNENEKVKKYLKEYNEVESLFKEINEILFNDFKGIRCHAHRSR